MKKIKNKENSIWSSDLNVGGVSYTQKALFAKHLAVMLKAGLTISQALNIAYDSAKGSLKYTLKKVLNSVETGNSFSDSLARHKKIFDESFIMSVYAGEQSGTLINNLEFISIEMRKEKALSDKIRGASVYPAVVFIATIVLGLLLSFFILPKITPLFTGLNAELPATTQILINFSTLVEEKGLLLFSIITISIYVLVWLVRQKFSRPFTHLMLLKIPIVKGIVINTNLARLFRTLGTLVKSGLPITEAIEVTSKTLKNTYYVKSLKKVSKGVSRGNKLSDELELYPSLFPLLATSMVSVGEESGSIDESFLYLSEFYESEVDNATRSLSTIIEPLLLLVIGLVVGFLALSIITPIYDITGNIQR